MSDSESGLSEQEEVKKNFTIIFYFFLNIVKICVGYARRGK